MLRMVGDTDEQDGQLPWPYVGLEETEVWDLHHAYPELVTVCGVVLPSVAPGQTSALLTPFKSSFVFDASMPRRPLSAKSTQNLRNGWEHWEFTIGNATEDWCSFRDLYGELVARRCLAGTPFDFPRRHFDRLRLLPYINLYGARSKTGWGAMLCAARFGSELHLIHIVVSEAGLKSNASYVLMDGLIGECDALGTSVFLGGAPAGDSGGVTRFKMRWSNSTRPLYMLRMVIRPDIYERIAVGGNDFFPAYRRCWSI